MTRKSYVSQVQLIKCFSQYNTSTDLYIIWISGSSHLSTKLVSNGHRRRCAFGHFASRRTFLDLKTYMGPFVVEFFKDVTSAAPWASLFGAVYFTTKSVSCVRTDIVRTHAMFIEDRYAKQKCNDSTLVHPKDLIPAKAHFS